MAIDAGRLGRGLQHFSPANFPYLRFIAALLIGAAGGWLFAVLQMPLPWLLGSMMACTAAAFARLRIAAPRSVRLPMSAIIGVMLGAGFSPELFGRLPSLAATMLGMAIFVLACGALCTAFLHFVARLDLTTAYFSGMPGGLIDMVLLGDERGGDPRIIALLHSARISILVFTLPFLVQMLEGVDLGPRTQPGPSVFDEPLENHLWLVASAAAGVLIGTFLRFPASYLTGPLAVSATIHASGLSAFVPSTEIVSLAQLVLGAFLGCSFVGTAPRELIRVLTISLGATAVLLVLTIGFAVPVSRVSSYGLIPLILAYSLGGLAEMSLIALALRIDVGFVVIHHMGRVFLVILGATLLFPLLRTGKDGGS